MDKLLIIWQAVASRIAGGGIIKHPPGTGELMFSLPVAFIVALSRQDTLLSMQEVFWISLTWTFAWFQTGHAVAFHMNNGVDHEAQNGRKALLSEIIDPLCLLLRRPIGGNFYCWSFIGLKGFLVHLTLGLPIALAAVVAWPLAYFIGNRIAVKISPKIDGELVAEFTAGAFSGALLLLGT